MNLNILAWNVRGIMSSTMCLAHLLDQYDSDIVIVSEHKLKPNSLMYRNSIDNRYTSVSKSDRLGSGYNCTHGKGCIYIMYNTTLQFAIDHIYETNSERIVGIQIKCKTYEPLFVFGVYLPADSSIDNFREELNTVDDLYTYYSNYGKVVTKLNRMN